MKKLILLTLCLVLNSSGAFASKFFNQNWWERATEADVRQELKTGADVNARGGFYGETALIEAAKYSSNPKVIKALIDAGADVNARNDDGKTALMHAVSIYSSNPKVIKTLIDAGADVNALADNGESVLTFVRSGEKKVMITNILKQAGAKDTSVPSDQICGKNCMFAIDEHAVMTIQPITPNRSAVIKANAFYKRKDFVMVKIEKGITVIGEKAFASSYIASVEIPDTVVSIENEAFLDTALSKVEIPNSVKQIKKDAFRSAQLKKIKLPNELKFIEEGVFANHKLESIEIPNSVFFIAKYAFLGNQIKQITISDTVKLDDRAFSSIGDELYGFIAKYTGPVETVYCRGDIETCRENLIDAGANIDNHTNFISVPKN